MSSGAQFDDDVWLGRLRQLFGRSVELTSKLHLEGLIDVVMRFDGGATAANMQTDEGAFEVWALALRAAGARSVHLALAKGDVPAGGHGGRFRFRVDGFLRLFSEWFRLAPDMPELLPVICEPRLGPDGRRRFVLNRESEPRNPPTAFELFSLALSETEIERLLAFHPDLSGRLGRTFRLRSVGNQLPVGLFEGDVGEGNKLFTGGKSAVDLWGVGQEGERLVLFELKKAGNEKLGALSELLFYSLLLHEVQTGMVRLPLPKQGVTADYLAIPSTTCIKGYLLAPGFHPLLEGYDAWVLNTLNSALAAQRQRITLGLAELGKDGSVTPR